MAARDLYCCLLPQCEALRTCRSGFPIATQGVGSGGFIQVKPKVVKFHFTHSKLRKYSFLQKIELEKSQNPRKALAYPVDDHEPYRLLK